MNNADKLKALLAEMRLGGDIDGEALKKVIDTHVQRKAARPGHVYRCGDDRAGVIYAVVYDVTDKCVVGVRQDGVSFHCPLERFHTLYLYSGPLSDYAKVMTAPAETPKQEPPKVAAPHRGGLYRHVRYGLCIAAAFHEGPRFVFLDGDPWSSKDTYGAADPEDFTYLGRADKLLYLTTDAVATDEG